MIKELSDMKIWEDYKKTVQPLKKTKRSRCFLSGARDALPSLSFIRRRFDVLATNKMKNGSLSDSLDLHHLTLQEAYEKVLSFIDAHFQKGSKEVLIITGKGLKTEGALKKNLPLWLEKEYFRKKIREYLPVKDSLGQFGSFKVFLKRKKSR